MELGLENIDIREDYADMSAEINWVKKFGFQRQRVVVPSGLDKQLSLYLLQERCNKIIKKDAGLGSDFVKLVEVWNKEYGVTRDTPAGDFGHNIGMVYPLAMRAKRARASLDNLYAIGKQFRSYLHPFLSKEKQDWIHTLGYAIHLRIDSWVNDYGVEVGFAIRGVLLMYWKFVYFVTSGLSWVPRDAILAQGRDTKHVLNEINCALDLRGLFWVVITGWLSRGFPFTAHDAALKESGDTEALRRKF